MKTILLLTLSIPLLSVATLAQTPDPSEPPTSSPTSPPVVSPSPSPSSDAAGTARRRLPEMVELLATGVMLGSVLVVFLLVRRQQELKKGTIGPRHIQFVSVCLIVPTILILGLETVLSRETTATLIGGLTGYLLSGLGKYEPPKDGGGGGEDPKTPDSTSGADSPKSQRKNELSREQQSYDLS